MLQLTLRPTRTRRVARRQRQRRHWPRHRWQRRWLTPLPSQNVGRLAVLAARGYGEAERPTRTVANVARVAREHAEQDTATANDAMAPHQGDGTGVLCRDQRQANESNRQVDVDGQGRAIRRTHGGSRQAGSPCPRKLPDADDTDAPRHERAAHEREHADVREQSPNRVLPSPFRRTGQHLPDPGDEEERAEPCSPRHPREREPDDCGRADSPRRFTDQVAKEHPNRERQESRCEQARSPSRSRGMHGWLVQANGNSAAPDARFAQRDDQPPIAALSSRRTGT
jgi:hypothetical protein